MTTQPTHETSKMEDAARTGTGRVKMAWFEHGNSRIYYEEQGSGIRCSCSQGSRGVSRSLGC